MEIDPLVVLQPRGARFRIDRMVDAQQRVVALPASNMFVVAPLLREVRRLFPFLKRAFPIPLPITSNAQRFQRPTLLHSGPQFNSRSASRVNTVSAAS